MSDPQGLRRLSPDENSLEIPPRQLVHRADHRRRGRCDLLGRAAADH